MDWEEIKLFGMDDFCRILRCSKACKLSACDALCVFDALIFVCAGFVRVF